MNTRENYILYVSLFNLIVQIFLLTIWFKFRFNINLGLSFYKKLPNKSYLIINLKTENNFKNENFRNYKRIVDEYENLESNAISLMNVRYQPFKAIFHAIRILMSNREINFIFYCFICNLVYIFSNYKLLLVLPIFSVINLYSLFDYFFKAMISKYREFVAILFFIYLVEYIFSWISFLHFQEFFISEYVPRGNLTAYNVITLFFSFFKAKLFFTSVAC